MIKLDNEHLLMLEPKTPATVPVQDVWTWRADGLIFELKEGKRWRGYHACVCGASSQSYELMTPQGRTTNSLLAHYVSCHRDEVPDDELIKLYAEFMRWPLEKAKESFLQENTPRDVTTMEDTPDKVVAGAVFRVNDKWNFSYFVNGKRREGNVRLFDKPGDAKAEMKRVVNDWHVYKGEWGGGLGNCVRCGYQDELNFDLLCFGCEGSHI